MNKNLDEKPVGRSRRRLLLIYIALGHRLCIHTLPNIHIQNFP